MSIRTVAVDLDGTLAEYSGWQGVEIIGEPYPGAVEAIQNLLKHGIHVILHTCRVTPRYDGYVDRGHGYAPYDVELILRAWLDNHGLSEVTIWTGPGKPYADAYLDDRAITVSPRQNPSIWCYLQSILLGEERPDDTNGSARGSLGALPFPQ